MQNIMTSQNYFMRRSKISLKELIKTVISGNDGFSIKGGLAADEFTLFSAVTTNEKHLLTLRLKRLKKNSGRRLPGLSGNKVSSFHFIQKPQQENLLAAKHTCILAGNTA